MKRILRSLPFGLAALLPLGGCDTFSLDQAPKTFLSEEQFFRTAADAEAALVAAYAHLQVFNLYGREFPSHLMMFEDDIDGGGSYAPAGKYDCNSNCVNRIGNVWAALYTVVNRANLVISRVPEIPMNESRKQAIVGEAHFLRAWAYNNLVRYWGAVPLRLEPTSGLSGLAAPRAPVEEVYARIIEDLRLAEATLPDAPAGGQSGRATKWAAKALLAEVHLGREDWAEAAAKAEEVIEQGPFTLVRVQEPDDFNRIFGADVERSAEEIWDVPFRTAPQQGTNMPPMFHHGSAGYATPGYRAIFGNPRSFLGDWDQEDLRYTFSLYVGSHARFVSGDRPILFRKFRDPGSTQASGHGNDWPILRLSDALLTYAEAAAMAAGAPTPAAYDAVNRVRRRAYARSLDAPAPGVDVPAGLSLQAFRDAVLHERALEFLVEGKRYWDLKRTGKLIPLVTASGDPVSDKFMLWPIPIEELDANDELSVEDQNPGW